VEPVAPTKEAGRWVAETTSCELDRGKVDNVGNRLRESVVFILRMSKLEIEKLLA
jgi:hypothetical protein